MIQEAIIIEGYDQGMKFSKPIMLSYNPSKENVEEAIIRNFNSQAKSFEELAVQRGWRGCYWTFPAYNEIMQ